MGTSGPHKYSKTHTRSRSRTRTRTRTLTLSHSHTLSHTLSHSLTLSHTLSHSHSHTHLVWMWSGRFYWCTSLLERSLSGTHRVSDWFTITNQFTKPTVSQIWKQTAVTWWHTTHWNASHMRNWLKENYKLTKTQIIHMKPISAMGLYNII